MKNFPSSGVIKRASLLSCATACAITAAHAQSGTWTGTASPALWSNTANWTGGIVATGSGNTADFGTVDLPDGPFNVALDTPRTISNLSFGDINTTTAGSWLLDNNLDPLNVLTLDGTPVLTVNTMGTGAAAEISAVIAGTAGLSKAGAGTLTLSGANTYSGTTAVNAGLLNINNATAIGTSTLTLAGGNIGAGVAVTLTNNNAQNWNSNFTFAGPSNLAMGTGAINVPGAITLTATAGQLNLGGVITSTGTFIKDGAGEVLLSGANLATFTGPMTLKGGLVRIRGNLAAGATGAALNQEPIGSAAKTITFEGGALMLNGATGSNGPTTVAFTNPVVVAAGQSGTVWGPQRGTFNSTLTGSGTFNFIGNYVRGDLNGTWTGFTGTVNFSGANTAGNSDVRINGANMLHAGLTVNITNASVYQPFNPPNNAVGTTHAIGKLSGTAAAFMGGSSVGGRFVNWQVGALNQDSEYAGVIANSAGAARLYKVGTGTLILSGPNTYTGDTQLNAGKISVGNGGATGSLAATNVITIAGTQLIFNRDNTTVSAYPGILSGPGTITKRGTGQVNFTGVNTYTAGTAIEGGIIGITSPASLGAAAGAVNFTTANGGVLSIVPGVVEGRSFNVASGLTASFGGVTAADSLEVTNSITGAGSLAVGGAGILTLSGANAYAGTTTVNSGSLVAANLSGSATSAGAVALSAGTLAGEGTISGAVTVGSGVSLKPGSLTPTSSGVGNLTVGSLALAGGSTLYTEFASGSSYDKITVTATNGLTSSASLANPVMVDLRVVNSAAKWTTPGTYTILQFAGSFVGNANDLFEVTPASQQAGQTYTFSVVGSTIQLVVAGNLPSIWNVDAPGNWSNVGNWVNGSPNAIGATAQFDSKITGPQTVTLDAGRTVGLIQFNNANSYTIDGTATLTLNQAVGNAQVDVLSGSHTISAPIQLADSIGIDLFNGANSLALTKDISGGGGIAKSGPGNLTLGGNNSFGGALSFANGTLTFSNNSLGAGALTLNNASLVWAPGNSQDITVGRTITFGNDPITFSMDSDVILANDFGLSGTANLTKDGTGKLTITADTTFSGNLTVLNGNLTLGDGGATGSINGGINLANASSVLTISRSGDYSLLNLISGTGSLVLDGNGLQTLLQGNTFSGTTTINGGSAVLGSGLALQNSSLLYNVAGGNLDFGGNFAATVGSLSGDKDLVLENSSAGAVTLTAGGNGAGTTYTGLLSGTGSFTKAGAGIMTFTAPHTYSGATQVNGGALELDSTVTLNNTTISVGATGRLTSNGATLNASLLSNVAAGPTGGAALELLGGTANFPAGLNALGNANQGYRILVNTGATLSAGPMSIGRSGLSYTAEPAAGSATDGLVVNGGDVDIAGNLLLGNVGGANSSVNVRMDAGSLDVTGPISIGLNNGGRWSVIDVAGGVFNSTDTATGVQLGGPLQGNAAFLTRAGVATAERFQFGQAALGGTSTVHVSGGELYVGSGGMVIGTTEPGFVATLRLSGGVIGAKATWSTALPVATSNVFGVKAADAANAAHDITLSGTVTGTGSLVKSGAGTLTLSGTYNYTGSTNVSAGTLTLNTATLSDTGDVDVATGGFINLPHGQVDTVHDFLINGLSQGPGTYTSANSSGRITGTGSLYVAPADPYLAWIGTFPVGALTGKADDADHDGLTNLEEFALDGNPANGAATGKVRSRIETVGADQALVLTLPVRTGATFSGTPSKTATVDDLLYTIKGSNALAAFDQGITEITVSSAGMPALSTGWTYRTFRLDGAVATRGPRGFIAVTAVDAP